MNILVIGAGGREHALAYKLNQSNLVKQVFVIPGNEAMTPIAEVHTEISESNHQGILDFAKQQNVDWVVIGLSLLPLSSPPLLLLLSLFFASA